MFPLEPFPKEFYEDIPLEFITYDIRSLSYNHLLKLLLNHESLNVNTARTKMHYLAKIARFLEEHLQWKHGSYDNCNFLHALTDNLQPIAYFIHKKMVTESTKGGYDYTKRDTCEAVRWALRMSGCTEPEGLPLIDELLKREQAAALIHCSQNKGTYLPKKEILALICDKEGGLPYASRDSVLLKIVLEASGSRDDFCLHLVNLDRTVVSDLPHFYREWIQDTYKNRACNYFLYWYNSDDRTKWQAYMHLGKSKTHGRIYEAVLTTFSQDLTIELYYYMLQSQLFTNGTHLFGDMEKQSARIRAAFKKVRRFVPGPGGGEYEYPLKDYNITKIRRVDTTESKRNKDPDEMIEMANRQGHTMATHLTHYNATLLDSESLVAEEVESVCSEDGEVAGMVHEGSTVGVEGGQAADHVERCA